MFYDLLFWQSLRLQRMEIISCSVITNLPFPAWAEELLSGLRLVNGVKWQQTSLRVTAVLLAGWNRNPMLMTGRPKQRHEKLERWFYVRRGKRTRTFVLFFCIAFSVKQVWEKANIFSTRDCLKENFLMFLRGSCDLIAICVREWCHWCVCDSVGHGYPLALTACLPSNSDNSLQLAQVTHFLYWTN